MWRRCNAPCPQYSLMDQRTRLDAMPMARDQGSLNDTDVTALRVDLQRTADAWRVVIERDGQRRELGSIDELIRYLRDLSGLPERRQHGLR